MLSTSTLQAIERPDISLPDSLKDLTFPDGAQLLRRADVPGRVDAVMDAASDAARAVIEQLPGQRRRRRPPILLFGLVVGALTVTGVAAWWMRRSAARMEAREALVEELEFDRDAHARATDEGMTGVPVGDEPRLEHGVMAPYASTLAGPAS